ncbi:hypothetical protein RXV86_08530 [Alisedimentitalea sp. MJ-SS2]|uniref:hypothetical protein n=1 Tax=Aliisedimentitalea sp. MJ-SS2 TaxID=3049795 RepID=UPI00290DFFCE|nr:hypothetical protein [Alisedimentitalea sp. MJ-SS2]MDU8927427.1 hypothetical protein [Alisedimentitalea sp. MJ-SS2]
MRHSLLVIGCLSVAAVNAPATWARADSSIKHTASLTEFIIKVDALDQVVDDIVQAGALALLSEEYPTWTFDADAGFGETSLKISNDIGAIAGRADYGMPKIRGAIARNQAVSDEQRARALEAFGYTKELLKIAYDLDNLVTEKAFDEAATLYRNEILHRADDLNERIRLLTDEISLAVKLSAF